MSTPPTAPLTQTWGEWCVHTDLRREHEKDQTQLNEAREQILELKEALRVQRVDHDDVLTRCIRLTASLVVASGQSLKSAKEQVALVEAHATEKKSLVALADDLRSQLQELQLHAERCKAERWKAEHELVVAQVALRVAQKRFEEEKQAFEKERSQWADRRDSFQRTINDLRDEVGELRDERNFMSDRLEDMKAEIHEQNDDAKAIEAAANSLKQISSAMKSRVERYKEEEDKGEEEEEEEEEY